MEAKQWTETSASKARSSQPKAWIDQEMQQCQFKDARLAKRFRRLVEHMCERMGSSIPFACQDWAATKAAYRFFSNDRVDEHQILAGHFQATRKRSESSSQRVLVLHDTTEFSYRREDNSALGLLGCPTTGITKEGRRRYHTLHGILMHSSLAVTTDGLPLGLTAIKFWSRKHFKGCNALKRKINPTRVPIEKKESIRWLENVQQSTALLGRPQDCIHIGDRESDIYELFCTGKEIGTHFLIRTCVDRLAGDGKGTVAGRMKKCPVQGEHRFQVRNRSGEVCEAILEIKYQQLRILPPIGKQNRYPALTLTVIYATERGKPRGRERINWKLITNLSVGSLAEAVEKLEWYAMRWNIEVFHKILKSGYKAEESKLRTSKRLVNLISLCCILSWRIFWMTMVQRTVPEGSPALVLTQIERDLLDKLAHVKGETLPANRTLSSYLIQVAQLGGYLARASDPPPGNLVMWRGLSRLIDIQLGFSIGQGEICG